MKNYVDELMTRYPCLLGIRVHINNALQILTDCFSAGGKLLIAGNGGSAADALHIAGELGKAFVKRRAVPEDFANKLRSLDFERGDFLAKNLEQGLPVVPLTANIALATATLNDRAGSLVFAQQVYSLGKKGDVFLGISTSGKSENIAYAVVAAKALGMKTLGLAGRDGGILAALCDETIIAPAEDTYKIQELHLPIYHALCLALEEKFY
jgi:D-sedoheptulose 7-phosphate isomerase